MWCWIYKWAMINWSGHINLLKKKKSDIYIKIVSVGYPMKGKERFRLTWGTTSRSLFSTGFRVSRERIRNYAGELIVLSNLLTLCRIEKREKLIIRQTFFYAQYIYIFYKKKHNLHNDVWFPVLTLIKWFCFVEYIL